MAAGVIAAAAGLLSAPAGRPLPSDAVARVNDTLIRREEYDRTVAATAQDRREPLREEDRRRILDRLIDEELLVQRALELGLASTDRKIRADLASAMIAATTEEHGDVEPDETELRRFYEENLDFFSGPGRLRLRQVFVRVPSGGDTDAALDRARRAAQRLRAGEAFAEVRGDLGDPELAPVPDTLLPPAKLRYYIGPTALQTAIALDPGGISEPVRSSMGYHVLQVVERQPDRAPPFAEIRHEVVVEFRRRAGEEALRRYIADLRRRADVAVAEDRR
jgi:hypothetical protein